MSASGNLVCSTDAHILDSREGAPGFFRTPGTRAAPRLARNALRGELPGSPTCADCVICVLTSPEPVRGLAFPTIVSMVHGNSAARLDRSTRYRSDMAID